MFINDIYGDMLADADHFDTSAYPATHFLLSTANKKVLSKMKDETARLAVSESIRVGLRSKIYIMVYGEADSGQLKRFAVSK